MLRAPHHDGSAAVLLQHRAAWSHQGGTWGLPGGARDSHETVEQAAIREAHEEAGLSEDQLTVRTKVITKEVFGDERLLLELHDRHRRRLRTAGNHTQSGECGASLGRRGRCRRLAAAPRLRRQLGAVAHRIRGHPAAGQQAALSSSFSSRAAARGSSAAVIARTTTTRRAPAAMTSPSRAESIPPMANHGLPSSRLRRRAHQVKARCRAARFCRRRPARPDAEVVDIF